MRYNICLLTFCPIIIVFTIFNVIFWWHSVLVTLSRGVSTHLLLIFLGVCENPNYTGVVKMHSKCLLTFQLYFVLSNIYFSISFLNLWCFNFLRLSAIFYLHEQIIVIGKLIWKKIYWKKFIGQKTAGWWWDNCFKKPVTPKIILQSVPVKKG